MNKTVLAVPLIVGALLISDKISVNINHHMVLPSGIDMQTPIRSHEFVDLNYPFIHTAYDIYLQDTIEAYKATQNIVQVLGDADKGDTVLFHLAGYGGSVESGERIINAVTATKALVTMQVEAPVYSMHAFIAVSGNKLVIQPFTYMMFHNSSAINVDCSQAEGIDRNETNEQHCIHYVNAHLSNVYKFIYERATILTPEEKQEILDGKDVYINANQVLERQQKGQ